MNDSNKNNFTMFIVENRYVISAIFCIVALFSILMLIIFMPAINPTGELQYELAEDLYKNEVNLIDDMVNATNKKYGYKEKTNDAHKAELSILIERMEKVLDRYKLAQCEYLKFKQGD